MLGQSLLNFTANHIKCDKRFDADAKNFRFDADAKILVFSV